MITCNMPTPQAWYEYRSELGGATRGTLGLSGLVLLEGERGWGGVGTGRPDKPRCAFDIRPAIPSKTISEPS